MSGSRERLSNDKVLHLGDFQCNIISLMLKIYHYFYNKQIHINLNYCITIVNLGKIVFYTPYAINYKEHFSTTVTCLAFLRCTTGHRSVSAVPRGKKAHFWFDAHFHPI